MADRSIGNWLGSAGLIAMGLIVGSLCSPQSTNAQQEGTKVGNDFVVIQGYVNDDGPVYYMVTGDGKATPISYNKAIIKVPDSDLQVKLSVEHVFPDTKLNVNHSGAIAN